MSNDFRWSAASMDVPRAVPRRGGCIPRRFTHLLVPSFLIALLWLPAHPVAAEQTACFSGRDPQGYPALVQLAVERYGDYFEVYGFIQSLGTGQVYQFKADGNSGAGRVFQGHEYSAGAAYMQIRTLNETFFVFEIQGYGVLQFRRAGC